MNRTVLFCFLRLQIVRELCQMGKGRVELAVNYLAIGTDYMPVGQKLQGSSVFELDIS